MLLVAIESPFAAKSAKDPCLCIHLVDGQGHRHERDKCERCWRVVSELAENQRYLRAAILDSLRRGEAPYASHGFFPQVLDDDLPAERRLGMEAGFAWGAKADLVAVYWDLGVSLEMEAGLERVRARGGSVEWRKIEGWVTAAVPR